MEEIDIEKKVEELFAKKMTELEIKPKKFTVRWVDHLGQNGEELIEEAQVDWWVEDMLQSQFVILAGDKDRNASVTFPANNLRAIYQNFEFNEDMNKYQKLKKEKLAEIHKTKKNYNQDVA